MIFNSDKRRLDELDWEVDKIKCILNTTPRSSSPGVLERLKILEMKVDLILETINKEIICRPQEIIPEQMFIVDSGAPIRNKSK
jgi:hypothetical protein